MTGANGLIGNELVRSAEQYASKLQARGLSRQEVDLFDKTAVTELYRKERPQLLIHCAAVAQFPLCEANPELAQRTNVSVTKHLVQIARDIPFVFFSTDLVFDGTKGNYAEEDAPNPLSVYGRTKSEAEDVVRNHPAHLIVRLSLTGGHSKNGNRGFNEEMKNAWRDGRTLNLFVDEYRCPSTADVVGRAVWDLIEKHARGTFHLCGPERLSRFEIGQLLARKHPELAPRINATSRSTYQGPPRPPDTSMNCAKARALLSFEIPRFSNWLAADETKF